MLSKTLESRAFLDIGALFACSNLQCRALLCDESHIERSKDDMWAGDLHERRHCTPYGVISPQHCNMLHYLTGLTFLLWPHGVPICSFLPGMGTVHACTLTTAIQPSRV